MCKLIEVSIRGSTYYFLNDLDSEQIALLKHFASQFYPSNPKYRSETDDSIAKHFVLAVQTEFNITLRNTAPSAVLIIK